jgi:hypothetical protein
MLDDIFNRLSYGINDDVTGLNIGEWMEVKLGDFEL